MVDAFSLAFQNQEPFRASFTISTLFRWTCLSCIQIKFVYARAASAHNLYLKKMSGYRSDSDSIAIKFQHWMPNGYCWASDSKSDIVSDSGMESDVVYFQWRHEQFLIVRLLIFKERFKRLITRRADSLFRLDCFAPSKQCENVVAIDYGISIIYLNLANSLYHPSHHSATFFTFSQKLQTWLRHDWVFWEHVKVLIQTFSDQNT